MGGLKEEPKETTPLSGKPHGLKRLLRHVVPEGFCYEAKKVLELAIPVCLSLLMLILVKIVGTIFAGHLGKIELDAVTLASALTNITGVSIGLGMTYACDTLMSQTFGSKNVKRVGVILQRGILIMMLCCFPCWAIFLNTEQLLLLCRQDPAIARLVQEYVLRTLPGLPAVFLHYLLVKYLETQGIIWPQVITGFSVACVNAGFSATFIYALNMGVRGAAWANTISEWLLALSLFTYIIVKKLHVDTWGGWSKDCLQEWGLFMKLAIPSLLMICVEWWSFEIGGFLSGLINAVELGGQAITMQLAMAVTMLPTSFGIAANVRIGNQLGAGETEQAKKSYKVVICCTALTCLVASSISGVLRHFIGHIFTSDNDVIILVSRMMLLFAPFQLFDGINQVCGGILRGIGRQTIGAATNVLGYYLLGLPIGITMMFAAKLGALGLWIGMLCSAVLQNFIYIPYLLCLDWNKVSEEARIRAGVKQQVPDSKSSETKDTFNLEKTGDKELHEVTNEGAVILPDRSSTEDDTTQLEKKEDLPMETTTVVGEILSTKQLIVRRGLAVFLAVGILAVGVIVRLLTAKS